MLDSRRASEIFPFSIQLNDELDIVQLGRTLSAHLPVRAGAKFTEAFEVQRWRTEFELDSLQRSLGQSTILRIRAWDLCLLGAFHAIEGGFLFLGGPRVERLEDLTGLGLSIGDFAPHDAVMNYLFLLQELRTANRTLDERAKAIHAQNQRAEQLLQQSKGLILSLGRDGTILLANPAALERLELELGKTKLQDLTTADSQELWRTSTEQASSTGQPQGIELKVSGRSSRELTLRGSITVNHDKSGADDFLAFLSDVTEELRTAVELHRAQQMEALGRLAGSIAHDFNNILAVIMGAASLTGEALGEEHEAYRDIDLVLKSATQGAALAKQLLTFSRGDRQAGQSTEIVSQLRGFMPIIKLVQGSQTVVNLETTLEAAWVAIESSRFEQVIINLAFNARDAMPTGGRVTITLEEDEQEGHVCLRFVDTGVGMSAETCRRAFEPFFTTKEGSKGTGIGLSIVFGAVSEAGGTVDLTSVEGEGTQFEIRLPCCSPPPELAAPADDARSRLIPKVTAVVEDEPGILGIVSRIVERLGSRVLTFSSATEARQGLAGRNERLDLLITDVALGDGNGLDLAEELVDAGVVSRVLVMTGYANMKRLAEARTGFGWEVLMKPFNPSQLREAIAALMTER
jgi:signal transduction histidine kinase/CheY-like chemotaxis protein